MYRILGIDGSVYGPVTETQVRQWINEGRANAQTQVQAEGATEWKPLSAFPEFAPALAVPPMPRPPSAFVQPPASPEELNDILKRDYTLDIGGCVSRGWEMLKADFWPILGITALVYVISFAAGMVPYVGSCISLVVNGPLMGGLYWYYIKRSRGMNGEIGDAFAGFTRNFLQLFLAHIIAGLAIFLMLIPGIAALIIGVMLMPTTGANATILLATGAFLFVAALPVSIYLGVAWGFSIPLIMEKNLPFWDAMQLSRSTVHKHWWTVFGMFLLCGIIAFGGVLLCCIGFFVTAPIAMGAKAFAYESIFGSLYKKPSVATASAAAQPQY